MTAMKYDIVKLYPVYSTVIVLVATYKIVSNLLMVLPKDEKSFSLGYNGCLS